MSRPRGVEDMLSSIEMEQGEDGQLMSGDIIVPKRCSSCKIATVCSVLPSFMNLSKIKIIVSIEACPFNEPLKPEVNK